MNRKPRIVLIPNVGWWIVGEMGKQIIARFGHKYDFYFLPETVLGSRPDLLRTLVPAVDAIHCLNESALELLRGFDPAELPPIATWIHHVTQWSPDHQMAIDRSSALTVCTNGWKQYLEPRVSPDTPITLVPHGVDANIFRRTKVPPQRFGIPPGRFVLGFIGTKGSDLDGGRKGTDVLLDVVHSAARRLPDLHVVLGGIGWDQEMAALRAEGVSVSAPGYIHKSDLPALYSSLDVYLLTSRVEGGPCTVFEAMACETPVVSTRVGAVPDLILDGVNGYSAAVDDRDALLAAILALHDLQPTARAALGANARQTVSQLPWGTVLEPLEAVYDDLVARRRQTSPPLPGPRWMDDPQTLLRASCAADALAILLLRLRKRSIGPAEAIRLLREMLDHPSLLDIARGAAIIAGAAYKPTPRPRQN